MTALFEFQELYKIYQMGDHEVRAVDGINLTVEQGEFVAIVGQSGSGKSTCMNIIGCLDVPTSGHYYLDGKDVGTLSENELAEVRNKMIGFIFQQYNLLPKIDIMANVEISMAYAGVGKTERHLRAKAVLERVGLGDKLHHMPNQLSGGQQQRVSIARALAGDPSIILADEPTGALDSRTGREVMELLCKLHEEGNTVVLITHDNELAEEAERVVRLADGQVVEDRPTKKRYSDTQIAAEQGSIEQDTVVRKKPLSAALGAAAVMEVQPA